MAVVDKHDRGFTGFSIETFEFLRDIQLNNNKSWFEEHREGYEDFLLKPLKELVIDLWPAMAGLDPRFDPNPSASRSISRIHRDVRFSRDKSPYKSNMWITFKRQSKDWKEAPCFFFEIFPDSYRYGMGFYCATKETMDNLRKAIDSKPKEFLKLVLPLKERPEFVVEGERYKRLLGEKSEEINDWYQRKNLCIICSRQLDDRLFTGALVNDLMAGFEFLAPLYHYLWKIKQS